MEKRMTREWKGDNRPAKGLWLPGKYCGICKVCGDPYIGDRRSVSCADCAYDRPNDLPKAKREESDLDR